MKDEFLKALSEALNELNYSDVDETIAYYEELISDKLEEGMDEEEIINNFGSCQQIAKRLVSDDSRNKAVDYHDIIVVRNDEMDNIETKKFPIADIEKIKIESCSYNFNIVGKQIDEIVVDYVVNPADSFRIYEKNGALKLKEDIDDLLNVNSNNTGNHEATIYLPIKWDKKITIELVDGDVSIISVNLDKLNIETVTGTITIDDLDSHKLDIRLTSGDAVINDCKFNKFNFKLGAGNLTCERLTVDKANIEIMNGDAEISVLGNQDDYQIHVLGEDNNDHLEDEDKYINADVVTGKFVYSFIND